MMRLARTGATNKTCQDIISFRNDRRRAVTSRGIDGITSGAAAAAATFCIKG
jgi:hypothetical protein